jgi:hypothetical protein
VAGIEELKQIERFATANFSENDSVGPVPETRLQEIAYGNGWNAWLGLSSLEADEVRFFELDFGRVFYQEDPVVIRNDFPKAFTNVVLPVPVPPLMRMFCRLST